MTIDELITYCEEKEYNHRLSCKSYDAASGYTRSKDKNIRTACAIREEKYADYYKEISATMRKYQKLERDLDKIRAEIFAEMQYHSGTGEEVIQAYADGLHNAIRIIDKYKAKSEGEK